MKHFLLSIQQPDGGEAPPEILEPIMRNVDAFNSELKAAGAPDVRRAPARLRRQA